MEPNPFRIRSLLNALLVFLIFFIFQNPSICFSDEEKNEVVVAVMRNWPPHYLTDEKTRQPSGFAIDIFNEIAKRCDLNVRYETYNIWPDIHKALQEGRADLVPNMGIIEQRLKLYNFTTPVETFNISIFVRETTNDIIDIEGLNGRTVGVVKSNKGLFLMKEKGISSLRIFPTVEQAFLSLISGNVDALVYPKPTVISIAQKTGLQGRIKIIGKPLFEVKRGIAVNKSRVELFSKINLAVENFITTSEYKQIYKKWFEGPEPYWNGRRIMFWMSGILISSILFLLVWRYFSIVKINKKLEHAIKIEKQTKEALQESETNRIKSEKEKQEMDLRLQRAQKMEAIGNLAGGIAHDFNNILFPIIGMSEMLIEDLPKGSLEYENSVEIFKAGKRGSDLVQQILAFSRQSEHKMIPLRIQQVLNEVLKLIRSSIPASIEIRNSIQHDCGLVEGDATHIHQIAMNLITNAYHAVSDKNGQIIVELKEIKMNAEQAKEINLKPGKYAMLSISDNGHGVDPKIIEKIFEPYFTTKDKDKGTGLGLATVYGIVKEHKGEIQVKSVPGEKTTFDVYFPLLKRHASTNEAQPEVHVEGGDERILLVDDEESVAMLEKQILERLGYKVTARTSSPDALAAFKNAPDSFDIVISDMTMPNMTGDQLTEEILSVRPDIPVIICTGFSENIDNDRANEIGVKGLLMKPVVKAEIAQMIREVLDTEKST